jgi:hypothetical protein
MKSLANGAWLPLASPWKYEHLETAAFARASEAAALLKQWKANDTSPAVGNHCLQSKSTLETAWRHLKPEGRGETASKSHAVPQLPWVEKSAGIPLCKSFVQHSISCCMQGC